VRCSREQSNREHFLSLQDIPLTHMRNIYVPSIILGYIPWPQRSHSWVGMDKHVNITQDVSTLLELSGACYMGKEHEPPTLFKAIASF